MVKLDDEMKEKEQIIRQKDDEVKEKDQIIRQKDEDLKTVILMDDDLQKLEKENQELKQSMKQSQDSMSR